MEEGWLDELRRKVGSIPPKIAKEELETPTGLPLGKSLVWGLTHIRGFKLPNKERLDEPVGD